MSVPGPHPMRVGASCAAMLFLSLASQRTHAQLDLAYSFTSGTAYDGFNWPKAQWSKQTATGLAGGQFDTPDGVSFNNFSGNPANFDADNLLTRPAGLIENEAWWTDPKIRSYTGTGGATFHTAVLHMSFNNTPDHYVSEFGFDLAYASVSADVPLALSYTGFDSMGFTVSGQLNLNPSAGFAPFRQAVGTFATLNSPRVGREARFFVHNRFVAGHLGGSSG